MEDIKRAKICSVHDWIYMRQPQARWYIGTVPIADWNIEQLPKGIVYCRGQHEKGATGYEHVQFVFNLSESSTLVRAKSLLGLPTCHLEATRSVAAVEYCWKEDTRIEGTQFEWGTNPMVRSRVIKR